MKNLIKNNNGKKQELDLITYFESKKMPKRVRHVLRALAYMVLTTMLLQLLQRIFAASNI